MLGKLLFQEQCFLSITYCDTEVYESHFSERIWLTSRAYAVSLPIDD